VRSSEKERRISKTIFDFAENTSIQLLTIPYSSIINFQRPLLGRCPRRVRIRTGASSTEQAQGQNHLDQIEDGGTSTGMFISERELLKE
jgi:hypothetical protein